MQSGGITKISQYVAHVPLGTVSYNNEIILREVFP